MCEAGPACLTLFSARKCLAFAGIVLEDAGRKGERRSLLKPVGPLMIEHRLIERMVRLMREELASIELLNRPKVLFLDASVDFFRTYADRTHHGKEEDILFRDLGTKALSPEHSSVMEELVQEHIKARTNVRALAEARQVYAASGTSGMEAMEALGEITARLKTLVDLYPPHIEKEDRHFFIPILEYFSQEEQDEMLREFREFDGQMIHEKYKLAVEAYEK